MKSDTEVLFISDLHLDQDKPVITQQLTDFIKARAVNARALYILGDLFEVWLGDDDESDAFDAAFQALSQFSQQANLYFLHGNRDFLLGKKLADKLNMTLLPDPYVIQLDGHNIALTHGDLLCTDDHDYQDFRRKVRQTAWQQEFLSKPLTERQNIAAGLRQDSNQAMDKKAYEIMDVNPIAVTNMMQELQVRTLIHGHTHRPCVHQLGDGRQRIVLGDWQPEASYISYKNGTFNLVDSRI